MQRCCAAAAAALGLLGAAGAGAAPAARRPNFLFLLIDDLGWNDIGFRGLPEDRVAGGHAEFETPNIDALAREAVMLNDYYINKFCSPTRSSLMSGRWTYNLGLSTFIVANGHPTGLPLDEVTIADSLAELGCAWAHPLSAPAPASASS